MPHKPTAGPWTANCFLVTDANGEQICHTGGTRYRGPTPRPHEAEANARLISAAPDLYEALRDFVDAADGSLERVERVFLQFYEETGLLAPGKSIPPEMHETEEKRAERHRRWALWATKRRDAVLEKAKAALRKAGRDA